MSEFQPWWEWGIWQYRSITTQANGAGGAVKLDVAPAVGDTMIIVSAYALNSGTNGLLLFRRDEDNQIVNRFGSVSSAATTELAIPRPGPSSTTDSSEIDSTALDSRFFRNADYLTYEQTGAGAQNDTITMVLRAFLSTGALPAVTKARSTNPSDVTIATPTVNKIA